VVVDEFSTLEQAVIRLISLSGEMSTEELTTGIQWDTTSLNDFKLKAQDKGYIAISDGTIWLTDKGDSFLDRIMR